jgi:hypothetical protein
MSASYPSREDIARYVLGYLKMRKCASPSTPQNIASGLEQWTSPRLRGEPLTVEDVALALEALAALGEVTRMGEEERPNYLLPPFPIQ